MWMRLIGLRWSELLDYRNNTIVDQVPQAPGVFKLYVMADHGQWSVAFVGHTANLQERLWAMRQPFFEQNEKVNEYVRNYKCAYSYAEVADPTLRAQAVKALVDELQPALNDTRGAADGALVHVCDI